jgi:hypothetical protein
MGWWWRGENASGSAHPYASDRIGRNHWQKEASRLLAPRIRSSAPLTFCLASKEETLRIPASAVKMLACILEEMARGNAVALIPVHVELTTQKAADMLYISRPCLIQLLDERED